MVLLEIYYSEVQWLFLNLFMFRLIKERRPAFSVLFYEICHIFFPQKHISEFLTNKIIDMWQKSVTNDTFVGFNEFKLFLAKPCWISSPYIFLALSVNNGKQKKIIGS